MSLNLEYYSGKDEYSDGDIEDKIIDFIKKYPDDYEQAFSEDSSWPVLYHLSDMRKNVISWYPFKKDCTILEVGAGMGAITDELCKHAKKVTSIELSKRRATAIDLRNKNNSNLEIIVGNYKDIKLSKKFDYIILNGVFEYSALYMDTDNPFIDFLNSLKKNLKKDGKILIAIENKYGLKYWCGANEDHTGIPFDGINNYASGSKIRTFSKNELEEMFQEVNMYSNFYYMFPDYKFPQVIYTDESLQKKYFAYYNSYHSTKESIIANEILLYKEMYQNNSIPLFSNSFFVELANDKSDIDIIFAKYNNNYRNKEYDIFTKATKEDRVYKSPLTNEACNHINNIIKIDEIIDKSDINNTKVFSDGKEIYSNYSDGQLLSDILNQYYLNKMEDKIIEEFDRIQNIILKCSGGIISESDNTFIKKYNIKLSKTDQKEIKNYYKYILLDITPNNIIVKDNNYCLFDQEWIEYNAPLEFAMYRAINGFLIDIDDSLDLKSKLFRRYHINEKICGKFEKAFIMTFRKDSYIYYQKMYSNFDKSGVNCSIKNEEFEKEIMDRDKIIKNQQKEIKQRDDVIKTYQTQVENRDLLIIKNIKEIEQRDDVIKTYQNQVNERDDVIKTYQTQVNERDDLIKNLQKEIKQRDDVIQKYQKQVEDRDENIKILLEYKEKNEKSSFSKIINKIKGNK